MQYDVEPYLLADWKVRPEVVERQYVALLASLRSATRAAGLALWITIPFWFGHQPYEGRTLDREALRYGDGVVIMAYRNSVGGVIRAAEEVLRHADDTEACRLVVAVETSCSEPADTTMCGTSAIALEGELAEIRNRLRQFRSFAGLAVHQYDNWRRLQ